MSAQDRASWSLNSPEFTGWNFSENVMYRANLVWDTGLLQWVKSTGGTGPGSNVAVTNFPNPFLTSSFDELLNLQVASATITYIGNAPIGSATSAAVWKIKRLDSTSGDAVILYAGGAPAYNQIFDNRAALTYS